MPKVISKAKKLNQELSRLKASGKSIGFVPTMGALHQGHMSLIQKARKENDIVVVSIFVNPTQFGPKEDLKRYPRTFQSDKRLIQKAKADFIFFPSNSDIYPHGFSDWINPGPLNRFLCGPKRPGHFRGVATVVKRLFDIVIPDRAYFGLKDYQQVRVIEEMARLKKLPVQIVRCQTVREKDGLAMSSRNRYLSPKDRKRALSISRALRASKKLILSGERKSSVISKQIQKTLQGQVDRIDYIGIADPVTLAPVRQIKGPVLIALACFIGPARLIDNLTIQV